MTAKKNDDNLTMLATRLSKEDAAAFRLVCERRGTTVSRMLSDYIKTVVAQEGPEGTGTSKNTARHAVLSHKNVDRLKHEVAFHNPRHLNPDKMMNFILDCYFEFMAKVRE